MKKLAGVLETLQVWVVPTIKVTHQVDGVIGADDTGSILFDDSHELHSRTIVVESTTVPGLGMGGLEVLELILAMPIFSLQLWLPFPHRGRFYRCLYASKKLAP